MPYVAAGIAILGAVQASKGAKAQAKGQAQAARFNAAVSDRNALMMEEQARQRLLIGKVELQTQQERFGELQAGTRVAYSKGGVDLTGTARLVMEKNAAEFDDNAAAYMMGVENEAQEQRELAVNARMQGQLQRIYARNYITAGKYKSDAALLAGAGQAAGYFA